MVRFAIFQEFNGEFDLGGEASDCNGGGAGLAGSKGRAQAPPGVKGQSRVFAFDSVTCVRPDRTLRAMRRNRTA